MTIGNKLTAKGIADVEINGAESINLTHFVTIALQLMLFLGLVYQFNLESRAFLHLGILTLVGWSIHYFLPLRFRLGFFVGLSLAGVFLVFGLQEETWSIPGLVQGAWIIFIGLALIGLCHLPIPLAWQVCLVLAAGILLICGRAGWLPVPWSGGIWPVLAAMFMFRLVLYIYQRRDEKKPATVQETLAYFFMLPNVCFPLFPVVDYLTFRRTYYPGGDRHEVYQTGVQWMIRGAVHLLLYRIIYQNFVNGAGEVENQLDLVQFMLWPFLLYLRVSGTFHIITGMMHLFGFRLPETHQLYYLSSSFTDFWRRINIYWKDFMITVVYYPVYFKTKAWGESAALVISTFVVFFATWILHAYQWFWLRGTLDLRWNDGLFWLILALLVIPNSLYELKRGRKRRLKGRKLSWRDTLFVSLRTIGVFLSICILWSFWSASSVDEWFSTWGVLAEPAGAGREALGALFIIMMAIGVPAALVARGFRDRPFSFFRSAGITAALAIPLLLVSLPDVYRPLGPMARTIVSSMQASELNRRDFANLERGYYENLMDIGGYNPDLWETLRTRPADWQLLQDTEAMAETGGFPRYILRPNIETKHHGVTVSTNEWGMRDRSYDKVAPPGTLRIAVVGASFVFGSGVESEHTISSFLEERLNRDVADAAIPRYEVLNFGVAGYSPLEILARLETLVLDFQPDYIFYVENTAAAERELQEAVDILLHGKVQSFPHIEEIARRAGVAIDTITESADRPALAAQLRPHQDELLRETYMRLARVTAGRSIPVVWIFLPRPEPFDQGGLPEPEYSLAREAGFKTIDLSGVYEGHELESLWVARWDHHPNAQGNTLISEKLYGLIQPLLEVEAQP